MRRPHTLLACLVPAAAAACDRGYTIVDDYGPPAGYAVVAGAVTTAAGAPAAGVGVVPTRCESPIGGFLGSAVTDTAGRYRLEGALPPVGAFPAAPDTLRVLCAVFTDRTGVARDSLVVRFRAAAAGPPLRQLDLRLPRAPPNVALQATWYAGHLLARPPAPPYATVLAPGRPRA